jgi:heat shock protein HslJ
MRMSTLRRAAAVGGLFLLLTGGCARPTGPGGAPDGWPSDRTFIATSVTENGAPKELVEGSRIVLNFRADGQLGAHAGCNSMSGAGRIESGALVVDELGMTEMGCPDGGNAQDAWIADLLTSRPALHLADDELTLTGDSITMVLLDREVADPDRPLAGTPWTVHTVFQGDSASSMMHPVPAVLTIEPSTGSFLATTGCVGGELHGTATVLGDRVSFLVTEEQPCVGGSNGVDEAVRATLTGDLAYEIEAGSLRLLRPDGSGLGLSAPDAAGEGQVEVDCGTVTVAQAEQPPESALACFLDAVAAGRSVHLTIVAPTVEGDPIPMTYRGDGGPSIQVTTDARQDRFGSGQVEYQVCEGPRVEGGWLAFAECTDAGTG